MGSVLGRNPWQKINHGLAVNYPTTDWVNAVTTALATFGIRFHDDDYLDVERPNSTGDGWNILLPRYLMPEGDQPVGKYHFKIEFADDTHVRVLGGRYVVQNREDIETAVLLTTDGGTSGTVADHKTIAIGGSVYIYLEVDSWTAPTTLEAKSVAGGGGYPAGNGDGLKLVIGEVTWNAGEGRIDNIEQYWTGGDWRPEVTRLDDLSLEYASSPNEAQIYDWDVAASTLIDDYTYDLLHYQNNGGRESRYTNIADLSTALQAYLGIIWVDRWRDLIDTVGDPTLAGNAGYIPIVSDQGGGNYKLELVSGGPGTTGPWWKLGNTVTADAYGQLIGDSTQALVIDLDNRRLEDGGGNWTCDWDAREFDGADWTFLAGTICKAEDTTAVSANDTGSIQCKGGINFQKLSGGTDGTRSVDLLADGTGLTTFTAAIAAKSTSVEAIIAVANGWGLYGKAGTYEGYVGDSLNAAAGYFTDSASIAKLCDGTYAVNAAVGDIRTAGVYYKGANPGITDTIQATRSGVSVDVSIAGGIIIGIT